ncbi:MAG TPA: hypothetical protein VIY08_05340 [Candidatus Nitrosocosmicus sp.]
MGRYLSRVDALNSISSHIPDNRVYDIDDGLSKCLKITGNKK